MHANLGAVQLHHYMWSRLLFAIDSRLSDLDECEGGRDDCDGKCYNSSCGLHLSRKQIDDPYQELIHRFRLLTD